MTTIADSSLRKLGLPIDIPNIPIVCPRCKKLVAKGVLGPGTMIQLRCRKGCKGADGKALLFPVVSLSGGVEVDPT
jgi:hypothetical protein